MSNWVPVSERLPEKDGCYLVYDAGSIDVVNFANNLARETYGELDARPGFYYIDDEYEYWERAYTHWMPLPEPPEEG